MKKPYVLIMAVVGLIFIGIGIGLMQAPPAVAPTPSPTPTPSSATKYEGKVICLPHKDTSGPQTLECAIGLETADGKKYGIKNNLGARLDTGMNAVISGTLATPGADEKYDVVGNITATEIAIRP